MQEQVDVLWHFVFKEEDLLIVGKSSFGGGVIFGAAQLFGRSGIGLITIPSDWTEQEQYIKIQMVPSTGSIFYNGGRDKKAKKKTDTMPLTVQEIVRPTFALTLHGLSVGFIMLTALAAEEKDCVGMAMLLLWAPAHSYHGRVVSRVWPCTVRILSDNESPGKWST
ncbi:hypothetical protein OIDMADRAFT_55604 [Oidiodendron maius Zn]|uniref:Uncharacterized protein n=1 Tax=Oidiodendron maius (strain Zn) TaxID=913774 RepID=A0A0C3H8V5_OIDMZ|nr:hypothetical protein OIDMADRAFT_55604 [Oidiodendron maius Zn]